MLCSTIIAAAWNLLRSRIMVIYDAYWETLSIKRASSIRSFFNGSINKRNKRSRNLHRMELSSSDGEILKKMLKMWFSNSSSFMMRCLINYKKCNSRNRLTSVLRSKFCLRETTRSSKYWKSSSRQVTHDSLRTSIISTRAPWYLRSPISKRRVMISF